MSLKMVFSMAPAKVALAICLASFPFDSVLAYDRGTRALGVYLRLDGAKVVSMEKRLTSDQMTSVEARACKKFQLDARSVLRFFDQATVVSGEDVALVYQGLPCEIHGVLSIGKNHYQFEINAGATGSIWIDDEHAIRLGCGRICNNIINVGIYGRHD